jgi:hypothetical protein
LLFFVLLALVVPPFTFAVAVAKWRFNLFLFENV